MIRSMPCFMLKQCAEPRNNEDYRVAYSLQHPWLRVGSIAVTAEPLTRVPVSLFGPSKSYLKRS
jgi:hypothetical protein